MKTVNNVVILKDSTLLNGYVMVKTFTLKSDYGSIDLKKSQVSAVEYRSASAGGKDKVNTSEGSTLFGDLLPVMIPVEIDGATLSTSVHKFGYVFTRPVDLRSTEPV